MISLPFSAMTRIHTKSKPKEKHIQDKPEDKQVQNEEKIAVHLE